MAQTAGANVITTVLAGAAGLYIASLLEATGRGQYAAVQAWFGVLTIVGEVGITAATCYYVARNPQRAADWLASSRNTLFGLGVLTGMVGLGLTTFLSNETTAPRLAFAYAFGVMPILFVAGSWTFALQATNTRRWNIARTSNAVTYAAGVLALGLLGLLTVVSAVQMLVVSVVVQAILANGFARSTVGLGKAERTMARTLVRYGIKSMAGSAPFAFNARIDQVLLTVLVSSADLGNYAVAVALTLLASPLATAFGGVIMPMLARNAAEDSTRLVRTALAGSLLAGFAVVTPIAAAAPFLATRLLGASFGDVPMLVALLAPGAILLGCNQVLGDILRGRGRPLDVAKSEAVGLVSTAVLLFALVPAHGARGAAIASSVAYAASFTMLRRQVIVVPRRRDSPLAQSEGS